MEEVLNLRYALDTLYFLLCGPLDKWMAAGFTILEAGMRRTKNPTDILPKNVALFANSCVMFLLFGYQLMYPSDPVNSVWPGLGFLLGADHAASDVLAQSAETWYEGNYYSLRADFFFQVVFVATAMSIVSGAVALPGFCSGDDRFYLPDPGLLEVGRWVS